MNYNEEMISLLQDNELIASLWLNEDATIWHTSEREDCKEISREEILGGSKSKKK